jgi:RNA polymerase sigma factor (sigma-70 family)
MAGFVHPPRWHHRLHARATDLQPQTVLATLDDHELVQRCRQGEQAAWAVLVRRFQRLVYTVPRTAGLPEEQAADVFQFSFQRLHQNLHRLEDPSRVRAWLVTTAKRETLRLLSENRRYASSAPAGASADDGDDIDPLAALPDPAPLQDAQLDALQQQHRLRAAVDKLDPAARQLVELLFLEEEPLPYAEIARRLQMPEGSIGPTRARCLAKLRKLLESP